MSFLTDRPVLIATQTAASIQASLTFSSIPQQFSHLLIVLNGMSEYTGGAIDTWSLILNGDTASNYLGAFGQQSSMAMFYVNSRTTNFSSVLGTLSASTAIINNYSRTGYKRSVTNLANGYNNSASAISMVCGPWYGSWNNTASAITSVQILPIYGTISTGTTIALYGLP